MTDVSLWLIALYSICISSAHAASSTDLNVVDVRRNIPLADSEPVYKDFYINGGEDFGFKKNQLLTLVRKVTVKDSSGSQTIGDMKIPVGQLKVLAVYPKLTVAREHKLFSRAEHPMLEQSGIMIGDLLDLKNPIVEKVHNPENHQPIDPKGMTPEKTVESEITAEITTPNPI